LGFGRFTSGDHLPWVRKYSGTPLGPSVHPLGKLDAIWTCFDKLDVKLKEILSDLLELLDVLDICGWVPVHACNVIKAAKKLRVATWIQLYCDMESRSQH